MKQIIQSPTPQLSILKEFHIDPDMTGDHYALLLTSDGMQSEEVAVSILNDLMDEDASLLTIAELRYLFTLVKIRSLNDNYSLSIKCTHEKDGKKCGCINEYPVKLSEQDLNVTPRDYKVPVIEFRTEKNKSGKFSIIPPPVKMEIALLTWFTSVKGMNVSGTDDKNLMMEYTFMRGVLHLVDERGNRVVNDMSDFEWAEKLRGMNRYYDTNALYDAVIEVNAFGVQDNVHETECKECGGKLIFRIPLLAGLTG